ncbi:thioesterase II family protein [Parvularcula marina]|uniref:thioesterase II family protein n=2 Tax=Parvularcula marina TaxID=2292771 RepID=UPI003517D648
MSDAFRLLSPRPMAEKALVLFPFAGAGAYHFRNWTAHLPKDVEPWALQLPGREDRLSETPLTEWADVMGEIEAGLGALSSARPMIFYGHSLGGLMALAAAELSGLKVERVVIGAPPARRGGGSARGDLLTQLEESYGPLPASFADPDIREVALPALEADLALLHGAPQISGLPDLLLLGTEDPSSEDSRAAFPGVEVKEIEAGHYFASSHVAETVSAIFGD